MGSLFFLPALLPPAPSRDFPKTRKPSPPQRSAQDAALHRGWAAPDGPNDVASGGPGSEVGGLGDAHVGSPWEG